MYKPPGPTWAPGAGTEPPKEIIATDRQSGPIKAWSVSALDLFKKCPHASFLKSVAKIKVERDNEAANRGIKLHTSAEDFIQGEKDSISKEFNHIKPKMEKLRTLYEKGDVEIEGDWAFDVDWNKTEWFGKDVWARIKLDVFHRESPSSAKIIDWKSGKKFGNEIKHAYQGMVYAIGAFMRYPELEYVEAEFEYIDQKDEPPLCKTFTRPQAMIFLPRLEKSALKLTTAKEFEPRPSKNNCMYCDFNETCEWRHDDV